MLRFSRTKIISTGRAPAKSSQLAPAPQQTTRTDLFSGLCSCIWIFLPIRPALMLAGAYRFNAASPVSAPTTVATVLSSGVDAIRTQHLHQEVPPVPSHPKRRFDYCSTTRSGNDCRTPLGSMTRWMLRGDVRGALDRTLPPILGAGMGLQLSHHESLRYWAGTPNQTNQPPVPPDANWCGTTGSSSE